MSKVIQNIKSNIKSLSQNLSSLLHRGQKSKDPYYKNNNRLYLNPARFLQETLGTSRVFNSRCSSTFGNTFSSYINNNKKVRISGIVSSFVLLILSTLFVYPIVRNLTNVEAATPTNSTTSLSITSSDSANVELLVKSDSGTFATSTSSQKLNFGVTTNNYAGYELTLLGKDSTYANLTNSSTNTSLTSISDSKESSEFSNGFWGYTLDNGSTYLPAPNNTTGYTIDTTSAANSTAKSYTLGIGAKADYSIKAGTYTNTYVLTAVGNSTPYVIYYRDNTGDSTVANLPSTQDEATSSINVPLSTTIPTRTGYTFSKWCEGTVSNDGTTCTGTEYSAGANFGIDRTEPKTNNTTTLYAVWTVKSYTLNITNNNTTSNPTTSTTINFKGNTNITVTPADGYYLSEVSCPSGYTCTGYTTGSDATSAQTVTITNGDGTNGTDAGGAIEFTAAPGIVNVGNLQGLSDSLCTSTPAYATDVRDNNEYKIARLGDGNCWMTQNLRYMGDTVDSSSTSTTWYLKSATSNVSADKTMTMTDLTSGNTYDAARFHNSGNATTGVWYNYAAASAMTITGSSNENTQTYDICPKGWRLPTNSEQSGITSYKDAYSPVTGGRYYSGSLYNTGYGYWWSATSNGSASRYYLDYGGSSLGTNYDGRHNGLYVRCIKKSPLEEYGVSTMQDIGNLSAANKTALLSSLSEGTSYTVSDSRDSQQYTVAKINSQLWMTRNLAIGCNGSGTSYGSGVSSKTLTNSDSNISASSWSTPTANLSAGNSYDVARMACSSTYGAWYNYAAASAGTITGSSNTNTQTYDICPKGWRLPTNSEQTGITSYTSEYSPVTGGLYSYGSLSGTGGGVWWSATSSNSANRYRLVYNGSSLNTSSYYRYDGYYVRCVLDNSTIADATYMQDVTAAMVANTADGTTATLTDSRDSQQYTVAKINGNLWMTQNLRLAGGKTIYNTDSNITATSYTLPSDSTSGFNNYTTANMHCSTNTSTGCWYNYMAATAGTITGDSNTTNATQDICPKGWRLPTNSEFSGITSYKDAFSPVTGGYYVNGSLVNTGNGGWWSATSTDSADRCYLRYGVSSLGTGNGDRYYGLYVRCIRSAS